MKSFITLGPDDRFLLHLLIAECDIVQLSVCSLFVCLSVNFLSIINISVPMIARIMKPCIVILLDILYKHAP